MENRKNNFINRSNKIHNNEFDYSLVDYKNNKTKVKIICKKHGVFEQRPDDHSNGRGCNICGGSNNKSKNIFIEESNIVHNNRFDYSLVDYKNNKTKVKIICKKHGVFEQTPTCHLKGNNCIYCSGLSKNTKNEIVKKSIQVHGDKYDYSLVDYKNNHTKIKIICKIHGIFEQTPKTHIYKKYGCPKCNDSKGEIEIKRILESYNILYETQKTFKNCKYKSLLKFDFYLPKYNCCIEYDGQQHFKPLKFFGGIDEFKKTQIRDKIKNKYCKDENINLLRIKYNDEIMLKIKKEIKI